MDPVQNYLRLCSGYCQHLGGLSWSSVDDAIEYKDGTTFAFAGEAALFLEGFASGKRLIHFGLVLHLLDLLRANRDTLPAEARRLLHAFSKTGRPLRNAGAFCAVLCRDIPEVLDDLDVRAVCDRLRSPDRPIRWFVSSFHDTFAPAELPPVRPAAFERQILDGVAAYTDEEVESWFRHGRGPVKEPGKALASRIPPPEPRTLTGVLDALLRQPRFAGVQPFVAQMVSALTLPPRRLAHQELPVGGYADVSTHGHPDQILPSQFALDDWDFLRRVAERELLYFRREEPHARTRHELVVLLDQGVRTWGDVRLVLTAAVIAFGKQADRKKAPFLVTTTAAPGRFLDPLRADEEDLARLLDASDLSPNPGLALEAVLEQSAAGVRDIVLLTHPRNLAEEDVRSAARRAAAPVRLFTVAMDGSGAVELSEVRRGQPVMLHRFQVDFARATPVPRPPEPASGWGGDIEPVGFPFRLGADADFANGLFDFDQAGEWLLAATQQGMLYAWKTDGSRAELLPRAMMHGKLLAHVNAVIGVAGGFVIIGRIGDQPEIIHYDFVHRTVVSRPLVSGVLPGAQWSYSREQHALLVWSKRGLSYTLDLATGAWYSSKAVVACMAAAPMAALGRPPGCWLVVPNSPLGGKPGSTPPFLYLDPDLGRFTVHGLVPEWQSFTPLADGTPVFKKFLALEARCQGNTLAVKVARLHILKRGGGISLHLFRGPEGLPLSEYPMPDHQSGYALSADGRYVCLQVANGLLEVHPVTRGAGPSIRTQKGGFSQHLDILAADCGLVLRLGRHHYHVLRWDRGKLELSHSRTSPLTAKTAEFPALASGVPGTKRLPRVVQYDPQRFVTAAETDLIVVGDRFGQVAVFDREQRLVCMFFAFRERIAGWMPDGTCFGPASLIGRPTPGALERFGRALREASQRGRSVGCK